MTDEEVIELLKELYEMVSDEYREALSIAILAVASNINKENKEKNV